MRLSASAGSARSRPIDDGADSAEELERACWNWGRATELIPLKLVWPPRLMLKEPQGIVRYLSDDELNASLKAAAQHSVVMYVAILFSIATGVRMSELRRFPVDAKDRQVVVTPSTTSTRFSVRRKLQILSRPSPAVRFGIVPNCFSSGAVTADVITSALAPG
jgi:integrase